MRDVPEGRGGTTRTGSSRPQTTSPTRSSDAIGARRWPASSECHRRRPCRSRDRLGPRWATAGPPRQPHDRAGRRRLRTSMERVRATTVTGEPAAPHATLATPCTHNSSYTELRHDPSPARLDADHRDRSGLGAGARHLAIRLRALPAAPPQGGLGVPDPDAAGRPRLLETAWERDASTGRPPRHLYRLTGPGRVLAGRLAADPARQPTAARASGRVGRRPRLEGA